ncbi:hypothetical protein [Streptococcus parasanguinis]|uniref:hypothetical protein n=1 Tax=Streptococcus parasanguinis TaxID=1318 RepID=UPI0020C8AC84|nr:hypothetical protein [Streptococcus parasanguinis]MCP9068637.1 hypothetical protein [Streptococcus parasanguinis]
MTKTTYEILNDKINNIGKELCKIGKENNLHRLSLLSGQLGDLKEDIARLLWLELPELNDSKKIENISKSTTGMFFHAGIFEMDAMRQAFFKRQAKTFFKTEEEQQEYVAYTENLYLESTKNFKEIMKDTNQNLPNSNRQEKRERNIGQFVAVISSNVTQKR